MNLIEAFKKAKVGDVIKHKYGKEKLVKIDKWNLCEFINSDMGYGHITHTDWIVVKNGQGM